MIGFLPSQPVSLPRHTKSLILDHVQQHNSHNQLPRRHDPTKCQAAQPPRKLTRRAILSLLTVSTVLPIISESKAERLKVEPYDANKSRRYVTTGRPAPDRAVPKFEPGKSIFNIDEQLSAQDLKTGTGDAVQKGTLVVVRWLALLEDGTTVDDTNEIQPALFRPGAHQVPPGVEDAVIGMKAGGIRRVSGTSERILSNIAVGNDIGERSLVPTGSTMYIDIFVDRINPFGTLR